MADLDPGPFDIWRKPMSRGNPLDDFVDWWASVAFWRGVIMGIFFASLTWSFMHSAEGKELDRRGVLFYCGQGVEPSGLITNDEQFLLGAMLVYLDQITAEDYMKIVEPKNRAVVIHWLKVCLDIELKTES